eukprot:COSAG06_NODE_2236_length_7275_cov_86.121656_10_plen_338_part_00
MGAPYRCLTLALGIAAFCCSGAASSTGSSSTSRRQYSVSVNGVPLPTAPQISPGFVGLSLETYAREAMLGTPARQLCGRVVLAAGAWRSADRSALLQLRLQPHLRRPRRLPLIRGAGAEPWCQRQLRAGHKPRLREPGPRRSPHRCHNGRRAVGSSSRCRGRQRDRQVSRLKAPRHVGYVLHAVLRWQPRSLIDIALATCLKLRSDFYFVASFAAAGASAVSHHGCVCLNLCGANRYQCTGLLCLQATRTMSPSSQHISPPISLLAYRRAAYKGQSSATSSPDSMTPFPAMLSSLLRSSALSRTLSSTHNHPILVLVLLLKPTVPHACFLDAVPLVT